MEDSIDFSVNCENCKIQDEKIKQLEYENELLRVEILSLKSMRNISKNSGYWNADEHERFLIGLKNSGNDYNKISLYIGTRDYKQTKSYANRYFKKLHKNKIL